MQIYYRSANEDHLARNVPDNAASRMRIYRGSSALCVAARAFVLFRAFSGRVAIIVLAGLYPSTDYSESDLSSVLISRLLY